MSVYNNSEVLQENDEITPAEEAFMIGYDQAISYDEYDEEEE